ncbi:MAG TPA: hypothetical protein DDW94_12025 [Deltaproteobacteria bacterium]|nr:MAG: hypothetical protein A2Z79_08170 [Deltaproteobacteria bacterium GWA2_55_82]OIJ73563.1 MAG: hypothetical protein A2V21_304365 [Deltaproteobacteria bacterium GWC2_55_46]HBG47696.1 hypothetical protein [Deltaproteobacteria bacterium]HCY12082.1 hypothetical protein [Deltaproteobacteria bacterium]
MLSRRTAFFALIAALVTAAVYLPALGNGFVDWDDYVYLYESEGLRLTGLQFLKWAFTSIVHSNWHPLTIITYGVEYELWGFDPFGYHLVNVLLHAANTFLVFVLASQLFVLAFQKSSDAHLLREKAVLAGAFMAAIVFGLHPQHVESVAWVSELKDVLSAFFFLLSVLLYIRYAKGEGRRAYFYALSFISFSLALLSKPMAITLPIALLILDFYPLGRAHGLMGLKKAVIEKLPFLALIPVVALVTVWAQGGDRAIAPLMVSPISERIDIAIRGFAFYLKKLFFPADLVPFYVRPLAGEFYNPGFFLSLFALSSIGAASVVLRRRALSAAYLYYLITLLPVIGLVQVSDMAAADRYSYLPSLGPVLFLSGVAALFVSRSHRRLVLLAAVFIPAALVMAFLTVKQIYVWKDSVSLWTQQIKVYPTMIQAYAKRAKAYEKAGIFDKAAEDYTGIINKAPADLQLLLLKRAEVYVKAGNNRMAIRDYDLVIGLDERNGAAYSGKGAVLFQVGDLSGAISSFQKVLEIRPGNPAALFNLGIAYSTAGESEKGIELIREAARLGLPAASDYLGSDVPTP